MAEKKLSKYDLLALSVGQVIGAGVITLIGPAINMTGRSAWISYLLAVLLGAIVTLPYTIAASTLKFNGGEYYLNVRLGGTLKGGMYITAYITQAISVSLMGTSMGAYLCAIFPVLNQQVVAVVAITLFYILNLLSINAMAKVQNLMTILLMVGLGLFIVVGLFQVDFGNLIGTINSEEFIRSGPGGVINAMYLYIFSCTGYKMTLAYGGKSENPTKDIPWAMRMTIPVILVIYEGIAVVSCGVLPFDIISGQTLVGIAQNILPTPLYVFFIIAGPIMCLTTTLNGTFSSNALQFGKATRDGWFPAVLGKTNRFGSSWIILTIIYAISILPVVLNFSITTITNNLTLILYILFFMSYTSIWNIPKKFPEEWKKSKMHMSTGAFHAIMVVCFIAIISVMINKLWNLQPIIAIVSIVVMAACMLFAYWRYKTGKVSVDDDRA